MRRRRGEPPCRVSPCKNLRLSRSSPPKARSWASLHTTQCQPTFGHLARSVFGSSTSGAARSGGAVRRTARPGDGSRSWRMTFSPGPASFIPGPKSASPSRTRGGSRVPEWGPLGSVRGALSNERPYRDLRNVVAKYPLERSHGFPRIQPNSVHRDYSRLRCGVGETQLGPSTRISAGVLTRTLVAAGYSGHTGSRDSGRHRKADERRSGR